MMFQPATYVPGAKRKMEPGGLLGLEVPVFDKKGRPVWDMPRPTGYVVHFKSAGLKRNYKKAMQIILAKLSSQEITDEEAKELSQMVYNNATKHVPVYHGMSASLANRYRSIGRKASRAADQIKMLQALAEQEAEKTSAAKS